MQLQCRAVWFAVALGSLVACTAVVDDSSGGPAPNPELATPAAVVSEPIDFDEAEENSTPLVAKSAAQNQKKDVCVASNAQEAWQLLSDQRPPLGDLRSAEFYFSAGETKMVAVMQQRREVYGEPGKSYVEVAAEVAERGSRVGSYSQVIATKSTFLESVELYTTLPPFWQQQIEDPQPVLAVKHYLFGKDQFGYIKFENDIASDLLLRREQGVELRCRAGESCRCL